MKFQLSFIIVILFISLVSASSVSVWQGKFLTGNTNTKYLFNFTVYDSNSGGNVCFSNETNLTTNSDKWWKTEQSVASSCNNASNDYFLEIRINGNLESDIDGSTRRRLTMWDYLRRDVADIKSGNLTINDLLRGLSPLRLEEVLSFVNAKTGEENYAFYVGGYGEPYSNVPIAFNNSLIFQTTNITNDYQMEVCFWDRENQKMILCLNEGAIGRATTIRRSFQIVGNLSDKENDENFTLCENANYVDCSTDLTGADLFVQDDIEAQSIYANKDVYAEGSIDSESGIGVPIINAINISTDNINADFVQAPLGKFTNITGDKLNIDLIYATDIVVTNFEVSDLITGGNAGTELCIDSNDVLCICGSCA